MPTVSAKPAAAAAAPAATEAPAKKGKGKLIVIIAAVLVLAGGGGGAWFFLNKKPHDAEHEEASAAAEKPHAAPTYMAMENMVVNLADPGGERFAQIGITLDLDNEKTAEKIKAIMPVVRSRVLMLASQRTSEELLKRDGKEKLADDVVAEVSRALGYEVDEPKPVKAKAKAEAEGDDEEDAAPKKKRKKKAAASPVNGVLFSAFIIQ
ncbi:Flagellar protein FliL [Burkholderiales bacterium 8X]|nr:Flagellar protein FliL [Burkholderiales bacterium 8X]